ncbi:hypothetical protein [Roseimaritima ulvae]|uniref:Uncharacterized protein n=1 Tax=Roseimaritima ulvae TaxID=980254 RepID=A0A5B9QN77_9BACT|nr:hypothetical protein [Roseimaritima ulvae]QEG40458.1 hypothetical protein UC8_24700 [Roseimaritima ulvae]
MKNGYPRFATVAILALAFTSSTFMRPGDCRACSRARFGFDRSLLETSLILDSSQAEYQFPLFDEGPKIGGRSVHELRKEMEEAQERRRKDWKLLEKLHKDIQKMRKELKELEETQQRLLPAT